ncbi:hypothetical protein ASD11_07315 [Aeromicrobium sp. Root495]|uniref:phage major capsid protein n=1 Tax=Aeromicrobium sp. Root495 TaxID=1736550 RepID=UPI0006F301B9|nr:phage major capsid protein [Aeromicrobium sp. Root495]KQY59370.1 hypothetical protein ASD11_07315 [Aeromicrobium sp. Root495]
MPRKHRATKPVDTLAQLSNKLTSFRNQAVSDLGSSPSGRLYDAPNAADRSAEARGLRDSVWAHMQEVMADAEADEWSDELKDRYESLEASLDEMGTFVERYSPVDRSGVVAPTAPRTAAYAQDRPLAQDQTFRGAVNALGLDRDDRNLDQLRDSSGEELSFGAVLRNAMADNRLNIVNSMIEGSDAAGGYLVPSILTADIIDLARNKARVLEAGARIVPMANRKIEVPTWENDPAPEWRAENAAIAEDDGELGHIELEAKSLAVLVKASRELLEDTNVDKLLLEAFAASFALKLDTAALYGTGANSPAGLKGNAGVTKTPLAANGASPTWDALVDSVGRLRDKNYDPNAQISADRTARSLAKLKETGTGAYLQRPGYLDGVPLLTTGQVPTNLTVGTSNDTADVFTGDWSKLYVGIRTNLVISRLVERYADTGQVGFVAWFRGDIVPARPAAFDIVTGVKA